ncbi:sensor histidine kinase [Sphaerisporangium sp. TRM90804]|uniref:sensor histidine kinase n=1 Tax=Sphaerisporangium sp. TRM90804 TaxID=3031113 RepID=UPI00244797EF|nr:sensor histidine kinase [Sphaerisporangium sp. TRM90804]MDH2428806.1 histidine kinase [Sphaerisporangium sp. TRM90804]
MPDRWRCWWAVAVFWVVIVVAFTLAFAGAVNPVLLIGPMVASYLVARYGPRRHLWLAWSPVVPFIVGWVSNGGPWWDGVVIAVLFSVCLLLGLMRQTRRAYRAALEERARWLERDREQQALLSAAAERARIAREVHDVVAHNLAVMVALADGAVASAAVPERSADLMAKVAVTGREALSEVRRLVGVLRDGEAPDLRVDALVDQVCGAGLPVTLIRDGPARTVLDLVVYRIVQEALTNTMKHAGPGATATVRLSYGEADVDVEVVDGGGDRLARPGDSGHGLAGMRERVASYGGDMDAGPVPGGGWRVHARLPVPP